jgi:hypothetical protein
MEKTTTNNCRILDTANQKTDNIGKKITQTFIGGNYGKEKH